MIDELALLVVAESPSDDRAALDAAADVLSGLIERRLGHRPERVTTEVGSHLLWSGGGDPRVLVLGHYDTVFPLGTIGRRPFGVTEGRAHGPGVFDMKAGIVQAIHAIASLGDHSGVELLLTCDEEIGSTTSRGLVEERARASGAVLVLEPSADAGALKIARKGTGNFEVVVRGRAAHAGLEPERGLNALTTLARVIIDIEGFADPSRGTTVTPTLCRSGTASNVVPAEAVVIVDVRVESLAEMDRITDCFMRLSADPLEIEILGGVNRPPMSEEMARSLLGLALEVDPGLTAVAVGGASDGNFTAAIGIPTLDGLGAVGGGAHADHEYVEVATMPSRAALVAGIIDRIVTT